jgi:alanyl-tRNA synthetase
MSVTKQYLASSDLTAMTTISKIAEDAGKPYVRLPETLFHAQGGGQKSDRGTIGGVAVTHVAHADADGEVNHYVESIAHLQVGMPVEIAIDPEWRQLNAKSHTAGHLIAAIGDSILPGLKAIGGHHWIGESRVEFQGTSSLSSDEILATLTSAVDRAVADNLPVKVVGDPFASRQIQIGSFPAVPCGGTHLDSLSGLSDDLVLTKVKSKGDKIRISYGFKA